MLFDDKYDNHFLHIDCGRAKFITFADYTLTAVSKPDAPAALAALAPALALVLAAFGGHVVARTGGGGTAQTATATEDGQWTAIKAFITETDVKAVRPAYFGNDEGLLTIYPAKLGGLTQASKATRLTKFEAYVQALEGAAALLTAAPGQAARLLLKDYRAVASTKAGTKSGVTALIGKLGPEAEAVCWALWDVHCAGLAVYARSPRLAAALFDYALLPTKKRGTPPPQL
ncbi:hypothetical protein [Hymenobacter terricola]|uniref:hypothetical protein n=1 Tax=Hymenobacter terricola TaxID=2819236 RepID=UPI001B31181A|nr:hypothetical protein [Hymenobacter terricola]